MDFKKKPKKKISLEEIINELMKLDKDINRFLSKTGYGCNNVQHDNEDLTERFLYFQYLSVVDQLKNVHEQLDSILDKVDIPDINEKKRITTSKKKINLQETTKGLIRLDKSIKRLLTKTGYDCDNIKYDNYKSNDKSLFVECSSVINQLENIHMLLDYVLNPVIEEGYISLDENGKYVLPSGKELINGSKCEVLCGVCGKNEWIYTLIEKDNENYYATSLGSRTSIDGLKVRIRE
jgi:archaellum component FlaC